MGERPELNGTPLLKDERIRALVAATEADLANGSPAGRIYTDSIGRALAAARRCIRREYCGARCASTVEVSPQCNSAG